MVGMPSKYQQRYGGQLIIALLGNPIWMHSEQIQFLVLHLIQQPNISVVNTANSNGKTALATLFKSLSVEGNLQHSSVKFRRIWMTLAEKSNEAVILSAIKGDEVNPFALNELACFGHVPPEQLTDYLITRDLSILQRPLHNQMYHSWLSFFWVYSDGKVQTGEAASLCL
jgi:hypothetical protein